MYKIIPLTLKNRVEIPVGAVVSLEVNEEVVVPVNEKFTFEGEDGFNYATLHLRKSIAEKGVLQSISTPFPEGYKGFPTIVVQNNHVAPIELLSGQEIASVWVFTQ